MVTPMPSVQYTSSDFVVSAGSVLFREAKDTKHLQICILYHRTKQEYLLPKGRKDCGETVEAAAVRETFEETGYPCELLPCRMPTRAPLPGVNSKDAVRMADGITEPIVMTLRRSGDAKVKVIWWFATRIKGNAVEKVEGTQTDSEDFESRFFDAEEALSKLSFQSDRDVASQALAIVTDSETVKGTSSLFTQ